jgi:6-phosphogluconolactonase
MTSEKEVLIFKSLDDISDHAVKMWLRISKEAIKKKGSFTVAISGGSTPVMLYKKLAALKTGLRWDKTDIFIVDERFVPYGDPESNFRMIKKALLEHMEIPAENIHPIPIEETAPVSASNYEDEIRTFFSLKKGSMPEFDLLLLGLGDDGHTASLFPGTPALNDHEHLVTSVMPDDLSKKERITITLPVINNADNICFMACGSDKADAVREVIENGSSALPAAMVKPVSGSLYFLIDESAGALLIKKQ